jgi:hypothetical protein
MMMELDTRLVVYFWLTTFNSLLDVVFQDDETALLSTLLAAKVATLYLLLMQQQQQPQQNDGSTNYTTIITRSAMGICLLATVTYWFLLRAPAIWDSTMWSMQTDTVVGLWLLLSSSSSSWSWWSSATSSKRNDAQQQEQEQQDQLCRTVAQMFGCYYAAAGFFKLNSHFMDPSASCATIFAVQHITYYLGPWVSYETTVKICAGAKPWAPIVTVGTELTMATCLMAGQLLFRGDSHRGRTFTRLGLFFILYFHLAVCMTPAPLDISMFAYQCGSRLILAHTDDVSLRRAVQLYVIPYRTGWILLAIGWTMYGRSVNFTPLNWSFAAYVPVLLLHTVTIRIESSTVSTAAVTAKTVTTTAAATTTARTKKPLWSYLAVSVAFFYAFGSIILGLQEEHTCNMFANLKIHGGSNHYLVPTGLLLTGPEIRIQQTNSWWFTTTYPADLSHTVQPAMAKSVLADIGNPAPFYFNGGANRVLELFRRGYVPHNGVFVPYTVPAMEFQRLFSEALLHDVNFTLEYVELPGHTGDEQWRATASARIVQVQVSQGTITHCQLANGQPCQVDRDWVYRPYETTVSWWRRKLSMFHGYPIVYNDDDGKVRKSITCFGP